jgi:hypothetical protein
MVNTILSIVISKLRSQREDKVSLAEMADWTEFSPYELKKILGRSGLRTKSFKKQSLQVRGYLRLELLELQERLEREAKGQTEGPIHDWFCQQCGSLFEARTAACPADAEHKVHRVLERGAATLSGKTKIMDRALHTALSSQGLTDYPRRPAASYNHPMWAQPGGGVNIGKSIREMYPNLPQARNFPDMPMTAPGTPGPNRVIGKGNLLEGASLRESRRPTVPFAVDPAPIPSA